LLAAALSFLPVLALAQGYPKGPPSLVIPLTPGDATDIAARTMGEELAKQLKVPVVPVNRPGAGAALGTDSVVKAPKDGYTILITINAALTLRRVLEPQSAQYDPLKDLTPLGLSTRIPTSSRCATTCHTEASRRWSTTCASTPVRCAPGRSAPARSAISPCRSSTRSPASR
jgi:tripartite-type tricarboxylate transporter receptor subunit TctC